MKKRRVGFLEAGVLQNLALLVVMGFAWTKLGLGAAIKTIPGVSQKTPLKPDGTCPPGWLKHGDECIKL